MGEQLVGRVTHYFGKPHVAIVEVTVGDLRVGDTIRVVGRTAEFTQKIESMQLEYFSAILGRGSRVSGRANASSSMWAPARR